MSRSRKEQAALEQADAERQMAETAAAPVPSGNDGLAERAAEQLRSISEGLNTLGRQLDAHDQRIDAIEEAIEALVSEPDQEPAE